jgi:hypothetical protein
MTTTMMPASLLASLALDSTVLDLLNKSYGKTSPKAEDKPKTKLAKVKAEKGEKSKKSVEIVWIIPAPKFQDHALFLSIMRNAGLREVERVNPVTTEIAKVQVFDAAAHRADAQFAVALYSGWTNEPWGTQVDRALTHARFALLPKTGTALPHRSPEAHSARWTAGGWTKGAPDAFEKITQDLEARERLATDEVATMSALYEMAGRDPAGFERRLLKLAKDDPGLAALIRQRPELLGTMGALAEQRLASVREDIAGFDFSDPDAIERRYQTLSMRGLPTFVEQLSLMHQFAKA